MSTEEVVACCARLIAIASFVACAHEPMAVPTGDAGSSASAAAPVHVPDAAALAEPSEVARGATVRIPLDGFTLSCSSPPTIVALESDGGKRVVNQQLPAKGMYFLDDKFTGYGMCDVAVCAAATEASVELVEYRSAGTRAIPAGQGGTGKAPVFQVAPLVGKLEVRVDYFASQSCTVPKTTTKSFVAR